MFSATPGRQTPELIAGRGMSAGIGGKLSLRVRRPARLSTVRGRFAGLYVIRPEHNPFGPFDFAGVSDERSDGRYSVAELVDRGYEDAYRQFIEPVVGASGERMQSATSSIPNP